MIVVLHPVVDELRLVILLQVVAEFGLSPLCPYEMSTLLRSRLLIFIAVFFLVINLTLANETLCFLSVPPTPALDNLSDGWVVVSLANIELEVVAALLWLYSSISVVKDLMHLLHQPDVNCEQEIWLLEFGPVQLHPVAFWH